MEVTVDGPGKLSSYMSLATEKCVLNAVQLSVGSMSQQESEVGTEFVLPFECFWKSFELEEELESILRWQLDLACLTIAVNLFVISVVRGSFPSLGVIIFKN